MVSVRRYVTTFSHVTKPDFDQ